jgi:hypothetical protein
MNERIKELAEQAETWNADGDKCEVDLEKFADSLVWECMKICEDVMKKDNSALACWSAIKGTFRS